ncbi:MAG TPA: LLM class flavin-dependent oxidoreductase [Beijerinckiaceae bacterium]|nr:LLM class flavin-dependent oxidoreductase [Beijerinckiaceae bacterium]
MAIGTFIGTGKELEPALERVRLAESLGYESVYTTHIAARDSLTVLTRYATVTERVRLGTGVLPIFSRTPASCAQTAATIDEISGGRMVLGLGVSHRVTVENWFDSVIEKPVTQMREYASICRAILDGEAPPEGAFFNTKFQFMGYPPRPDLPIYIAALSPKMLQLAGEIAEGVMLWLCNPDYIRATVIPEVTKGREKAGKSLDGFDVVAAVPTAVTDDPEAARNAFRKDLIPYASLPFYRKMLDRSGFGNDLAAFDEGMAAGDVPEALAGLSDELLGSLAGIGSGDDARAKVTEYAEAGATSPCIGGIPGTGFEASLEAVAELI